MREIIHIFFINLVNDIDNAIILAAVMRKYAFNQIPVILYTALLLTLSRTIYVGAVDALTTIPGLRLISGLLIIGLALRLALFTDHGMYRSFPISWIKSWFKMTFILILTDFSICLDSVIVTSELSTHLVTAAIGIFLSLLSVFILLRLLPELVIESGWIQIIAAGLISHVAILSIAEDPWLVHPLERLNQMLGGTDFSKATQIFAIDIAIIMIIIGFLKKFKHK